MGKTHARTKRELVKAIIGRLGIPITGVDTTRIVDALFDEIRETVIAGERVELRGFGVFAPKTRRPRQARNPKTGEMVSVAAKTVVTFKVGKEFKLGMPKPTRVAVTPVVVTPQTVPSTASALLTAPPAPSIINIPPGNPPGVA